MSDYIYGRNAVIEHLKAGKSAEKLFIQRQAIKGAMHRIIALAKEAHLPIIEADKEKMDRMAEGGSHQGVILLSSGFEYSTIEEILSSCREEGRSPFLVMLDELTDPHNVGAIIRTALAAGVDGIILPVRRSATINSVVHNVSAGASNYVKIARVNNLNQSIDQLKKENIWFYGLAAKGSQGLWETDFSGGVCLVIGNEGKGLSLLTEKKCDLLISIPMQGKLDSLNASCAASLAMYEVFRSRQKAEKK